MKTKFLLPNQFKKIGWFLLIPTAILGFIIIFTGFKFEILDSQVFTIYSSVFGDRPILFGFIRNNYTNTLIGVFFIIGAIFVALSKEKHEDEFIVKTRWESLVWAIYINYIILIFCFLFFFNMEFLLVMIFNVFTVLIFFIIRFYYILYKVKKSMNHEK